MKSEDIAIREWTSAEREAVRKISLRQALDSDHAPSGDIPSLTAEQLAAMVSFRKPRPPKIAVSVRLDAEVLKWLKSKGDGHLTRINDILANLMEAESRQPGRL